MDAVFESPSSTVFEGFLRRQGFRKSANGRAARNTHTRSGPEAPVAPPPAAKRRRVGENGGAAAAAADTHSIAAGNDAEDDDGDDDDDDLIVVGVTTAADRAQAARHNAVDLSDTPQNEQQQQQPRRRRQASAATWEEDSTWEDAPAQMVVTEKLLAEQIQQLATSKNFVDMSINDIRAKLACTFDQDLSAHRKTIKRIVKTYAGIT
jgi:hypothetical protein